MNEEQLEDLKRFIANTVSQTEVRLREELASKEDLQHLEQKIDDGFAGIGDALEANSKATDDQLNDHDERIATLEQAA